MLKVKISACCDSRSVVADEFKRLYAAGVASGVEPVDSYEAADVIFVTDSHHRNIYADVLSRAEHVRYYDKLICYSESDFPPDKIPGIYTCGTAESTAVRGAPFYFWLKSHDFDLDVDDDCERAYLFSFMGRNCATVRQKILDIKVDDPEVSYLIEDTTKAFPLFNAVKKRDAAELAVQKERYNSILKRTKFVLAPRGAGLSSFRQYEAMACGCVPVVISDNLRQPSCVDWERFSVRIAEADVDMIPDVLKEMESEFDVMSVAARAAYEKLMEPASFLKYIEGSIIDIYENNMNERSSIGVLRRAIAMRYVRRTVYRRKNDLKRFMSRFLCI